VGKLYVSYHGSRVILKLRYFLRSKAKRFLGCCRMIISICKLEGWLVQHSNKYNYSILQRHVNDCNESHNIHSTKFDGSNLKKNKVMTGKVIERL